MSNCLEIGHIASQFNLLEVDNYINQFLLENFSKIPDLCKLPFERLKFLLGSNDLQGNTNFTIKRIRKKDCNILKLRRWHKLGGINSADILQEFKLVLKREVFVFLIQTF